MFAYHEATKHTVEKLMRSSHALDWTNMPEPFRHYENVPVLDLPADAPAPEAAALSVLRGQPGQPNTRDGAAFLSQLLFHAAAISATKAVRSAGYRYALRVNPSSGNLHPTEFHFAARGIRDWPDGLYHYRASAHMAEQRAEGDWAGEILKHARAPWLQDAPLVFVLTSIAWREAWKYRSRAYRYCLHDTGHAWESLALSARASGCESSAAGHFADGAVSGLLQVHDEWPMVIVALQGTGVPLSGTAAPDRRWHGGEPNRLSKDTVPYPLIDQVHAAAKLAAPLGPAASVAARAEPRRGEVPLPSLAASGAFYAEVARRRRSALDFRGGRETITLAQLASLLDAAMRPHRADFEGDLPEGDPARYVQLYLYVHRVDGLEPGVYRYWSGSRTLESIRGGDHRIAAAGLSLGQDLAGNSCVTFSMIADLQRAYRDHGDRGYRYVHFEAGAIGQRLYICAEAHGFQSTGIGAFYDDQVHRYLDVEPEEGQVIYHFACGYAVQDERLEG